MHLSISVINAKQCLFKSLGGSVTPDSLRYLFYCIHVSILRRVAALTIVSRTNFILRIFFFSKVYCWSIVQLFLCECFVLRAVNWRNMMKALYTIKMLEHTWKWWRTHPGKINNSGMFFTTACWSHSKPVFILPSEMFIVEMFTLGA